MLEKEFDYFLMHQDELVKKYLGKFVVIRESQVVGEYDTLEDAYVASLRQFTAGTFLIQECQPGRESYTAHVGAGY